MFREADPHSLDVAGAHLLTSVPYEAEWRRGPRRENAVHGQCRVKPTGPDAPRRTFVGFGRRGVTWGSGRATVPLRWHDALYSSRSAGTNSAADQLLDPTAIAVGLTAGVNELHQITLHARQSRLFVRTATLTTWGDVNTPLEFDLFGTSGNESVSNSHNLRLRHAYGTLGGLLAGQTWSNFMMVSALPETLDFGGPVGQTFVRQAQVRWTQPFSGDQWSVALENPETVVTRPDGSSLRADDDRVFDLTGNIGFKTTRRGRRQCHWPVLGWSADRRLHRQYGQSGLARSGRRLRRLPARLDPTASINAGARGLEGDQSELRRRHSDAAHGVGPPESDLEPGGQHQHRCRVHLATNEGGLVIVRPARRRITAICRPVG